MPPNNRFQHQGYDSGSPRAAIHYLRPACPRQDRDDLPGGRWRAVGDAFRAARVAAVYLVHGTFIGPDAWGLLTDLSRVAPALAAAMRRWSKQMVDAVAGDIGNFTAAYAAAFQRLLGADHQPPIPVRLFHWSSENHHLGRADGAVRLIDHLASQSFPPGSRVLVWGHSHGGNVLALVTNLLGADLKTRGEFFRRARCFYRCPVRRRDDLPEWSRARQMICECERVLPGVELDLVTLGTPVRYGWDTNGYGRLIHFINHRPVVGQPPYRARFPPTPEEALNGAYGDLVQQMGIAGTNFAPPFWQWRAWWADVRLGRMLQSNCRSADLFTHWRMGVRTHDEGENLLVEYGTGTGHIAHQLLGHAVYTRLEWLPFHAEEVARRLYGLMVDTEAAS